MYKLNQIKTIHLEITSKCQASCPMCSRNIQGGVDNPFIAITEITLDDFIKWFPVDFIKQLDRLYMCGNLGDPVVAKDKLEIFTYLKSTNPNISLGMNTNGSARNTAWWTKLAKLGVVVRFGIDGLSDTHALYRIGTDWDKIITNAKSFIQAGGYAIWDMLVFDHNQHQIDDCKSLSKELGFKEIAIKNTSRFHNGSLNVLDKTGKTIHILYATEKSKDLTSRVHQYATKPVEEKKVISCKVKNEKSMYVSATGNVVPCCWLDMEWMPPHSFSRIDYMDIIGRHLNLHDLSLDEIFNEGMFSDIEQSWSNIPLRECSKQCGEVDKFLEQFSK